MPNILQTAGTTGAGAGALQTAAAPAATVAPSFHADMRSVSHATAAAEPQVRAA